MVNSFSPCPNILWGTLTPGAVTYIHDLQVMLHSVGCLESVPEPGAVTLHLYSPPIRRVRLYEPENNRVVERQPGFNTVRGKRMHMG